MADNRKKFLGPNAGTLRDPVSNEKAHGRMRNPPRFNEFGGFSSAKKAVYTNEAKLTTVGNSVV